MRFVPSKGNNTTFHSLNDGTGKSAFEWMISDLPELHGQFVTTDLPSHTQLHVSDTEIQCLLEFSSFDIRKLAM